MASKTRPVKAKRAPRTPASLPAENDAARPSQADKLINLALARYVELFHTPGDGVAYASFFHDEHTETWPVQSNRFRNWLAHCAYKEYAKAPTAAPLKDALSVLEAQAIHEGEARPVAVRIAAHDGAIYIDLADDMWTIVRIDAKGWNFFDGQCPVRFVRRRGMLALPAPKEGGSLDQLRPLVNLPDDGDWQLYTAWLVGALNPGRPCPALVVNGEQGSAKTTLCRMARALIDPNEAALRRPPRNDQDFMIAAKNGAVMGFDNISKISRDLSDTLCSTITGGAWAARALYTDDDEVIFSATRPVLINGIPEVVTQPDLLSRSILLTLTAIDKAHRVDEATLWEQFNTLRPALLGCLLTAVSTALRNLPTTQVKHNERMADFVRFVTAAEPALGWPPGSFQATYAHHLAGEATAALDCSVLSNVLLPFIGQSPTWEGTASTLLKELNAHADQKERDQRDWPSQANTLAGELRRLAPSLRAAGTDITFSKDPSKQRTRFIRWRPCPPAPSAPSAPSATATPKPPRPDGADDPDDARHDLTEHFYDPHT